MSSFRKSVAFSLAKGESHTIIACAYAPLGKYAKDSQGEYVDGIDTIEEAAASFMENGATLRLQHGERLSPERARVVESHVAHEPTTIGGRRVPRGALILKIRIEDESLWGDISRGRYKALSVGGKAQRDEDGRLRHIDLQEVSIVERGAFQGAEFLVAKGYDDYAAEALAEADLHWRILDFCRRAEEALKEHAEEVEAARAGLTDETAAGRAQANHNNDLTDRMFGRGKYAR